VTSKFWYSGTLVKVIDGDTADIMVDLGFKIHHKIRVRLYGVNTPESRTKDLAEKQMGLKAKEFTQNWLDRHKKFTVHTVAGKNDKYGRILAMIYSDDEVKSNSVACLNEDIVESGYARAYFGEGDKTWNEFRK
jgi:micrococcal nuclease